MHLLSAICESGIWHLLSGIKKGLCMMSAQAIITGTKFFLYCFTKGIEPRTLPPSTKFKLYIPP